MRLALAGLATVAVVVVAAGSALDGPRWVGLVIGLAAIDATILLWAGSAPRDRTVDARRLGHRMSLRLYVTVGSGAVVVFASLRGSDALPDILALPHLIVLLLAYLVVVLAGHASKTTFHRPSDGPAVRDAQGGRPTAGGRHRGGPGAGG